MILADKIILLRKKNGWSQEEFAEKMHVSRQAVSKWEGAQSVPDLERILEMSALFGVTTDYLLKDEMEAEEYSEVSEPPVRRISMEFANAFLAWRKEFAARLSRAVFLCILSPIPLLILGGMSQDAKYGISENLAGGVGLLILLAMVAAAVAVFVMSGFKNESYRFLENEDFEAEYGVTGMVKERQKGFRPAYVKGNAIGTVLCVLSPIPLLAGAFTGNELLTVILLTVTLAIVGVGVLLFVRVGTEWNGFAQILKEGDYSPEQKSKARLAVKVGGVYWPVVTAVYLAWSFVTDAWDKTWIVWPVAGVLFAGVLEIVRLMEKKREK